MTRLEENKMVIEKMTEEIKRNSAGTYYEEKVPFQLGVISTMLADISKSLAILADKAETEDKNA